MAKQKYKLNTGEKIVFKSSHVRYGFWGAYTHILTITNQSIILEKYGMLNNFKGIERFNYSDIQQAIRGTAGNGQTQLELYIGNEIKDFALQSNDENEMKVLIMAINDQMGPDAEYYNSDYYQDIVSKAKDVDRILELRAKAQDEKTISESTPSQSLDFSQSLLGFTLGALNPPNTKKAKKKTKKLISDEVMGGLLDNIGIRDIQDEFTAIGNEFRNELGLKPKMTYAEKKELKELEEKKKKQEIQQLRNAVFQDCIIQQKEKINAQKTQTSKDKMSIKEQMELLQQIKNLLDSGILTQDEFEKKKQEILNN